MYNLKILSKLIGVIPMVILLAGCDRLPISPMPPSTVTPGATNIEISDVTNTSMTIKYIDVTTNETGFTGQYRDPENDQWQHRWAMSYSCPGGQGGCDLSQTTMARGTGAVRTYTHTSLFTGTEYCYRVEAVSGTGVVYTYPVVCETTTGSPALAGNVRLKFRTYVGTDAPREPCQLGLTWKLDPLNLTGHSGREDSFTIQKTYTVDADPSTWENEHGFECIADETVSGLRPGQWQISVTRSNWSLSCEVEIISKFNASLVFKEGLQDCR